MTESEPTTGTTTSAFPAPAPTDEEYAAARPWYAAELAHGVERFLEPRRDTCPWCGSPRLQTRVSVPDLMQRKPGRFTLDECRTCRHVFQNPRLTPDGLDFYYRDFYDGLGRSMMETFFEGAAPYNLLRAEVVKRFVTPKTWLDVGTGYGYFAKHAREVLPDTEFSGLDMGAAVTEGERRGWLAHGYRGMFPELADSLAGQFDVLSMHHYLEHTRDPRAELDAAARVLRLGDWFIIEMPDPAYRFGKTFGKWWGQLLQPQHQHLIPLPNLLAALAERGFAPVLVASGAAHAPADVTFALMLALLVAAPEPRMPWLRAAPSPWRHKRHDVAWKTMAPTLFAAATKVDKVLATVARRTDSGNVYHVLARRVSDSSEALGLP